MSERRHLMSEQRNFPSPLGRSGGGRIAFQLYLDRHPQGGPMFLADMVAYPFDTRSGEAREVEHKRIALYWGEPTIEKLRLWIVNQAPVFTRPMGLVEREREVQAFLAAIAGRLTDVRHQLDREQALGENRSLERLQAIAPRIGPGGAYQDPHNGDWVFPETTAS